MSWRSSFGYEDWCSSPASGNGKSGSGIGGGIPGGGLPFTAVDDFGRNFKTDNEFIYKASDTTKLTFGGAYSNFGFGPYSFVGSSDSSDGLNSTTSLFTRLEHELSGGETLSLQWSGDFLKNHDSRLFTSGYSVYQNNVEAQLNFDIGDRHNVSVGGNVRWVRIHDLDGDSQKGLVDSEILEQWQGIFIIDRYELAERTTLESQFRLDSYDAVQSDWSGRLSLLLTGNNDMKFYQILYFWQPQLSIFRHQAITTL